MSAYVLIVILMLSGHTETSRIDFDTKQACQFAMEQLRADPTVKNNSAMACVPRR